MLKTQVIDGKTYARVADLFPSPLNEKLRITEDKDFKQLEADLAKHGELSPVLVNSGEFYGAEGEAVGGNTRIKLYTLRKKELIWVNIVSPKDEMEFVELATIHNGQYSMWNPDGIAEFLMKHRDNPTAQNIHFLLSHPVSLPSILNSYGPPAPGANTDQQVEILRDKAKELDANQYANATIKQIVLIYSAPDYERAIAMAQKIKKAEDIEDNADLFLWLLENYENNQS